MSYYKSEIGKFVKKEKKKRKKEQNCLLTLDIEKVTFWLRLIELEICINFANQHASLEHPFQTVSSERDTNSVAL